MGKFALTVPPTVDEWQDLTRPPRWARRRNRKPMLSHHAMFGWQDALDAVIDLLHHNNPLSKEEQEMYAKRRDLAGDFGDAPVYGPAGEHCFFCGKSLSEVTIRYEEEMELYYGDRTFTVQRTKRLPCEKSPMNDRAHRWKQIPEEWER